MRYIGCTKPKPLWMITRVVICCINSTTSLGVGCWSAARCHDGREACVVLRAAGSVKRYKGGCVEEDSYERMRVSNFDDAFYIGNEFRWCRSDIRCADAVLISDVAVLWCCCGCCLLDKQARFRILPFRDPSKKNRGIYVCHRPQKLRQATHGTVGMHLLTFPEAPNLRSC